MNSGCGMAPYDAVSFIINDKIEKATNKDNLFKIVRFFFDLFAMTIGIITGGEAGLITAIMVITLGWTVDFIGKFFNKHGFLA